MHLLIVHREEEIGEALRRMVQEYTPHTANYVRSESAALEWADQATECDLLATQLESDGVDGLTLAGSLGQRFSRLHTFFLPTYPLDAQRLAVGHTKSFPSQSTANVFCRRSNAPPARRERQIFSISSICFRYVA